MSDRHRRDRGALVALALALAAIVIVAFIQAWLGEPSYQEIGQPATEQGSSENGERQPVETVHWGLFSTKDTYAQWLMAAFSVVATGVSIWAVKLLRATLVATRDAVKAADDAVEITRDLGQAQTRAWVVYDGVIFRKHPGTNGLVATVEFTFGWKNAGPSPALGITIGDQWNTWPQDVDVEEIRFPFPADGFKKAGLCGPGVPITSIGIRVPIKEIIAAFHGGPRIFLWSRCEYNDVFPGTPRRHTEQIFEIIPRVDERGLLDMGYRSEREYHFVAAGGASAS